MRNIFYRVNPVPLIFLGLSLGAFYFSEMRFGFVVGEVITRFVRDGVMVLALILPISAGMGLNFAIVVGAICAQVGLILAVDFAIGGWAGLLFIGIVGISLSIVTGLLIGLCLNMTRGREMITTIIIGFFATSIYQLVFMVGYGTIFHPSNTEMMLSRGIGIRNMIDLEQFRHMFDTIWIIPLRGIDIPLFMVLLVCGFAMAVKYIQHTRFGGELIAVNSNGNQVEMLGISENGVRLRVIVISTVIACCGHIIYIQNIGMLNVYTAHLNTDIFSCAALLAGGATIFRARVSHALGGIILFHTLFIVSPQAGQNIFGNPSLGEYFRSFVAYGTITVALVISLYREKNIAKKE